jgi:AcrR family transcriptional regulator
MSATDERPRRADAVRNRARVVAAAVEVFAERGLEAGVPEVAARAGVGRATVYRSFPTKEHLVAAVVVERLRDFEARVKAALEAPQAWPALVAVLADGAAALAGDRALAGGMTRAIKLPELEAARASMWGALGALLERARAEGGMRADVTGEDLRVLWAGMCRVLAEAREDDPAVWRRYAALIAAALRADGTPAPRG